MNTEFTKIRNEIEINYSYYLDYLNTYLSKEKIAHCISTSTYALYMVRTKEIKVNEHKVILSGILHDLCREWKTDDIINKAKEFNIEINEYERKYPVLLHGPLAANLIAKELNISDMDIYEAIYWHTTGKANLGLVGQILYLSDFSEPLRKYSQAEKSREILMRYGFFDALFYSANERYKLSLKKRDPSPYSLEFINWLKNKRDLLVNAE